MNIVVCLKQVPDTASKIVVKDGRVLEDGLTWVVNPYDEYAVEEALRLREKHGGKVTLVTVGPERARQALKDALALGSDEGVLVTDPAFEGADPFASATILAAALQKIPYDLIWAGWKGVDLDQGQTAIILAEKLGLPHVSFVTKIEIATDGQSATVQREVEGGKEIIQTPLPAIFTAQKGLNEPRYASLKGIMAVKKKVIPEWKAADLGLNPGSIGSRMVETVEVVPPPERAAGRTLPGTPEEAVKELVRLLHEEAKVI